MAAEERTRSIARVVRKVALGSEPSDFAYWQTQTYQARLAALEEIRQEYHRWRYGSVPPLQKVVQIVKLQERRMEVVGLYPVADVPEPCHLIEVLVDAPHDRYDWGRVTQEAPGQPRDNWQVAYDEQLIEEIGGRGRYVFFFHDLKPDQPLLTAGGPVSLPAPQPMPARLRHTEYVAPD